MLAGQTSEFRKLVNHYQLPVFRFARNLIGDEHDAEDIAQDVFLAAFDRLSSFDANLASFLTWLFTITRNRCLNYRKQRRPEANSDILAHHSHTLSDHDLERDEFWIRLDQALDELPIEQKLAFILAEIEGVSYADIAHIEQTTLGTVKSRIHRAKQRLQAILKPIWKES